MFLLLLHFVSGYRLELIPSFRYRVKPHSSSCFSTACAAAISDGNHFFHLHQQNKSSEFKENFRQASNSCKRVLETAKFAYTNKTKESITFQKFNSCDFWQLAIISTKVNLLYLIYSTAWGCCLPHMIKQNVLPKNFSKNSNLDDLGMPLLVSTSRTNLKLRTIYLDDLGMPLTVFTSRTNLKLHTIYITPM